MVRCCWGLFRLFKSAIFPRLIIYINAVMIVGLRAENCLLRAVFSFGTGAGCTGCNLYEYRRVYQTHNGGAVWVDYIPKNWRWLFKCTKPNLRAFCSRSGAVWVDYAPP